MTKPVYQGAYSRRFSNYVAGKNAGLGDSKILQTTDVDVKTVSIGWDSAMGRVNGDGIEYPDGGRPDSARVVASAGSSVKLTATPRDGYHFVKWHGGPVDGKTSETVSLQMDGNYAITAEFAKDGAVPGIIGGISDYPDPKPSPSSDLSSETSKVVSFLKKWWWALAIAAWVCYEEMKGGGR